MFFIRLLGVDKLLQFAINEWVTDIQRNQYSSILGGVGPMHSFVEFCKCQWNNLLLQ